MNCIRSIPIVVALAVAIAPIRTFALGEARYVSNHLATGAIALEEEGHAAPVLVSEGDLPGVVRAAGDLGADIERVTGVRHSTQNDWQQAVSDGVRKVSLPLSIAAAGYHTLKVWMVDPGVVLERIVLDHGHLAPSYLGPPESFHGNAPPANSSSVESKAGQWNANSN